MTPKLLSQSGFQMKTRDIGNVLKAHLRFLGTALTWFTVLVVMLSATSQAQTSEAR